MLAAAALTWKDVVVALITATPGIIAAFAALRVRRDIRTPSGPPIGKMIEGTLHNTFGTNYRVQAVAQKLGVRTPPGAPAHEQEAEKTNGLTVPAEPAPPTTLAP